MDRRPLRVLSLSFPKRSLFKLGLIGGLAASHFHQSLREHCWEIESSPWMLYRRWRKHAPARGPRPGSSNPRATVHTAPPAALPAQVSEPQGRPCHRGRSLLGAVSIRQKNQNNLSSVLSETSVALPLCHSKADNCTRINHTTERGLTGPLSPDVCFSRLAQPLVAQWDATQRSLGPTGPYSHKFLPKLEP